MAGSDEAFCIASNKSQYSFVISRKSSADGAEAWRIIPIVRRKVDNKFGSE